MSTWRLTDEQIAEINNFAMLNNQQKAFVKLFPDIREGALLGISVRFLAPVRWLDDSERNAQEINSILTEIEDISQHKLFATSKELFKRGILELKYSSVYRKTHDYLILRVMEYITNEMMQIVMKP